MIYKVSHIKDVTGSNYLGIKFSRGFVQKYLDQLKKFVGEEKYETLTNNQERRDSRDGKPQWHMTLMNVMEYNKAIKDLGTDIFFKKLDAVFALDVNDLKILGLGRAERNNKEAYFIVLESEMLDEVRKSFGLNPKDLHVTLGFDPKDVFGVSKDEDTLIEIKSELETHLSNKLKEHGDWEFLFNINNFDPSLKRNDEIEVISLKNDILTVRIDHTKLQIGLIDGNLRVLTSSQWKDN